MASIKSKFSIGQELVARKSGKTCTVVGIYADKTGVSVDAQAATSNRAWRFRETELMTTGEAAKLSKEKTKVSAQKAKAKKQVKAAKKIAPAKEPKTA